MSTCIAGLPGNDQIRGLGGTDLFPSGRFADGADVISGGPGDSDAVSYLTRGSGISVDLDNVADDGQTGERDSVGSDVENLNGTQFDDTLIGSAAVNFLSGFGGRDLLQGLAQSDSLRGGDGPATVFGDAGNDSLTDNLDGDPDSLIGGSGRDTASHELGLDTFITCEVLI